MIAGLVVAGILVVLAVLASDWGCGESDGYTDNWLDTKGDDE